MNLAEAMCPLNRREFLVQTSATVALAAAHGLPLETQAAGGSQSIPAHRAVAAPGVHAYPLEHSVAAGGTLELCVSASAGYSLTIHRLGTHIDHPEADPALATLGNFGPLPLPVHPGSYIHIPRGLRRSLSQFTVEAWVRPWDLSRLQGVVSQEDKDSSEGFALGIGKDGYVGFYLGDGVSPDEAVVHRSPTGVIRRQEWTHLAATWDGGWKRIYVNGKEIARWEFRGKFRPGPHPLRLGAMAQTGVAQHFLDGDLAQPALYRRALSAEQIQARFETTGLGSLSGADVLAWWPLDEERGIDVRDASPNQRHGQVINHGTWMIGGPSFKAEVSRFGDYHPQQDRQRGHGIRFASDDLYDCRWPVRHRWSVPPDARSGIYGARFQFQWEGTTRVYHCTFLVRRAPRSRKAPVLFVCATNTWRAYNGTPFAITPERMKPVWGTGGIEQDKDLPAYCLYRAHAAGQGTYQVGLRMPWPAAGPHVLYGGATDYSHLMRADRFSQAWLEEHGYPHDVVSDVDLHRDPALLRGYKTVMIVGHNEYWSLAMYRSVERYLRGGGNLLVLSGNTLGWRVSFNPDCTVMECRKVDAPGDQVPKARRGEAWHSQDGLRGGPARECGMPGYALIGLDIIGWNNQANPKNFGPYVVEQADHFLFRIPEDSGLKAGDSFAWGGPGALPMANGHEVDIRPSTFAALQESPSPEGGFVPSDPPNITRIANGVLPWNEGGQAMDYFFRVIHPKTPQGGEMIYWERPDGGRVFNAGAIGSGWALKSDPKWAVVVRNALHHFGVPRPGK